HGNHDKCCSKFGLPVYELLKQAVGDRAWQCSHVGGDRFAANVVCFPYGIYYGHVDLEDVPKIVEASARKEIYLKNYRGRACYSKCDQVAEYFVRSQSGLLGLDDLTLISSGEMTAAFRSANGVHSVEFRAKDGLSQTLTCRSEVAKPIVQYELVSYEFRIGA
ncbi:MAG TPA: sucrase ferredoxin, partial [Bryobacteraceae bacterium]|nr:sucrase ferredoxin [Bryobacteraceae bacterium]